MSVGTKEKKRTGRASEGYFLFRWMALLFLLHFLLLFVDFFICFWFIFLIFLFRGRDTLYI